MQDRTLQEANRAEGDGTAEKEQKMTAIVSPETIMLLEERNGRSSRNEVGKGGAVERIASKNVSCSLTIRNNQYFLIIHLDR